MKSKIILFLSLICLIFIGCSERNTPSTPSNWNSGTSGGGTIVSYGSIQFVNNHSDPYKVVVKGNTSLNFTLPQNSHITKTVEVGYYNVTVTQQSGYIFYPTEKEYSFYVKSGENSMVSF